MSLIATIKAAHLQARKDKNEVAKSLLTTLVGEAETLGKGKGNRAPTDEEVVSVLKKFENNLVETIGHLHIAGQDARADQYKAEVNIIRSFMPAKLADDVVAADIKDVVTAAGLPFEQKSMGVVVKALKEKYGLQFDGAQVSRIFKTWV